MPFFIKSNSSGDWPTVKKFFVKTSTSGNWPTVKKAFVKSMSGWVLFWPKSGPYATTSPYFSTDQAGNTAVSTPTVLYGSTIYGQRGTWDANGGTISSYTYKLESSTSSTVGSGPYTSILSETTMSTTYQQLDLNTSQYDGKYLIFTVKATRSDGVAGSDSTDSSGTRLAVIRNAPVKKTFTDASISTTSTSLPATLSYVSQWNGSALYLPDSSRSTVKWYTASSGTYTAANIATYGTLVTSGITTDTPTNDGTTYTVTSTLVTPSSVPSGTYYYAVDSQFNSNTDYYNTTSGIQQYDVYGPVAFTPTPIGQSPSITGSTTVGNLAYFNIGSWTNSPTYYAWRIYYNYNLISGVLTYPGVKSVTNKTLIGFSAALRTSANHNYRVNDKVVITGMDTLFNKAAPGYTISTVNGDVLGFTIDTPTAYSDVSAYTSGSFVSFSGNAYKAVSSLPSGTNFSITSAYASGDNISFVGHRYRCLISLPASTAWIDAGTGYSVGDNVYYNSNRYRANSSLSGVSPFNGGTLYSAGAIVYSGTNRYQSNLNNNIGNSVTNTTWWSNLGSFAPGSNSIWTSVMPTNLSYWEDIDPGNTSYWTLQSFSSEPTSGTVTAPNYYEGTTTTADSFTLVTPTTDYKTGYDLRNQQLGIGVRAYNEIATAPQEYQAEKTVYGYPVITIGTITPSTTTTSLAYTSSYMTSYTIDVKSSATITSVTGGTSTVTYYAPNTFVSGQVVTITGINPSQYNITGTIATATSSYFTINTNISGSYVSGGTATASAPTYPKTSYSPSSPITITNLQELTTYTVSIYPTNGEGVNGVTKTSSFTTYATPTISNISVLNTKSPSAATSPSFSSNSSNIGTLTWLNGANSSSAWLKSVTGAGTLSTVSDPGTLNTSGTFTINSSGTANATVSAINKNKSVYVTWAQTKAASYLISYKIGTAPSDVIIGNSTDSNPEILVYGPITGTASAITINSVTVYHLANQQGPFTILSSGSVLTPTDSSATNTLFSGTVTYSAPPTTPTITYTNVTSSSFTVSWSSTYATSYNVNVYESVSGNSLFSANGTTATVVSPSGLQPNRSYSTTVTAINSSGTATNTVSQTTLKAPALTPSFGANTSNIGGFTGSVTNYDANYVWNISTNAGSVSWGTASGSTRPFTVTGLSTTSAQSATVTVTTTRNNYFDGSAQTTGSSRAPVLYTVTFDGNGADSGSAAPTSRTQTTEGGSIVIATQGTLTRSGYTFGGFNTNTSGTGTNYAVGDSYTPTSNITLYAKWTLTPVASVTAIRGSTGGRTGTTFWNDPKSTMVYTFSNVTSATARIQRSSDNINWTSGATESLSISSNSATQTTNQPTGNTSASANFYYRAQVISLNGVTLATPITSASIQNTITPKSNISLYP